MSAKRAPPSQPQRAVRIVLKKSVGISSEMRKNLQQGMAGALQTLSNKAAIKPVDLRLVMDEVLQRVGGEGNPNAAAAAEIDASLKRTLGRAVAGRVEKQDQAEVRKFLQIGLKNAAEEQDRTTRMSAKRSEQSSMTPAANAAASKRPIQKQTLQKRARPFRTAVA